MSGTDNQEGLRARREAMKAHRPTTSPTIERALARRLASDLYDMTKHEQEADESHADDDKSAHD
jgi:hypothetical protein